jgi:hypothetical protein
MTDKSFTISILVDQTPREAFKSINDVRRWWTENVVGNSQQTGDEFEVRFGDVHYSKQKLIEVTPDAKVVWLVTDSKLSFIKDKGEWTGTKIRFEISRSGNQTHVQFTHENLIPRHECFDACSNAWTDYIENSLKKLIATGKGNPAPEEIESNKTQ